MDDAVRKERDSLLEENKRLKDTILELGRIIKENKEKWKYLESRFVKVDFCSNDDRTKCPLYPVECEGDQCKGFVDLVELLEKACDRESL